MRIDGLNLLYYTKGGIIIMMKYLQKLGRSLMLPVAVLPVASILMVSDTGSIQLAGVAEVH